MKIKKSIKRLLIIFGAILTVALLCVVGVGIYVIHNFNNAYTPIETVKRSDEYVMPSYPVVDIVHFDDFNQTLSDYADVDFDYKDYINDGSEDNTVTDPIPDQDAPQAETQSKGSFYLTRFSDDPIYEVEQRDKDIINILLLGVDSENKAVYRGRSDTMIVASYNKKTGTVTMVSFLRDALVPIEEHGWNRLNTAYIFGGAGKSINTFNQLFDLDIQHYISIDMSDVREFIDYIGGIDVTLTKREAEHCNKYTNAGLTAGKCHLDGELALMHMRNRSVDNDFGRTRRQRDVITAIVDKFLKEKSLSEILDIAEYASTIVSTNVDIITMTSLITSIVLDADKFSLETESVPFSDSYQFARYNGMAVLSFDIESTAERINTILYGE